MTREGKARQDKTRLGKARHDEARQSIDVKRRQCRDKGLYT